LAEKNLFFVIKYRRALQLKFTIFFLGEPISLQVKIGFSQIQSLFHSS